jgi:hypothetical protein
VDIIQCVGPDQKQTTTSSTIITLETMEATDPWMLFLYALKAPATRDKYIQRLTKFLDFLGYIGTKEELHFEIFQSKREQIDRKEMAIGTVRNYVKSIKLFCDMADLPIPWAKIARGLPRAKRFADDRERPSCIHRQ